MFVKNTPRENPQSVAVSASSTQSTAFGTGMEQVRLVADASCYVKFGTNPTATSSDILLIANVPEFFGVLPGEKLAVLRKTGDGTLSCVEGQHV